MKKQTLKISRKAIKKAVSRSSKIEGVSFHRAQKDKKMIKLLQKHGRAFAVSR